MYDYLDGLTERPTPNQIATGLKLYDAFTDAVATRRSPRVDDYYPSGQSDGGYLKELSEAVSGAFAQLPARRAVTTAAARAARRCAQAQVRAHSIPTAGETQLRQWALNEATSTRLSWQAFLAGSAASVLSVHALIAAAANPRTTVEAAETIDSAYLSIGSVSTILDSLTDYERDRKTGGHNFLSYYEDQAHISADLVAATGLAINETQRLADGPHHLMILTGVAAYYCSAPSASEGFARPIARRAMSRVATRSHTNARRHAHLASREDLAQTRPQTPLKRRGVMAILSEHQRTGARHVAIIADGNGRWASARGLPVTAGHEAGADTLSARLRDAPELGIRQLTVYSFSTENWGRPADEVKGLIKMLGRRIASETPGLHRQGIRMRFIGRRRSIPVHLAALMSASERLTANNETLDLFIALNYGGRAEILDAASRFQGDTEQDFRECLYAPDMHDPELLIRTGGEQRLSNFLPWQTANAELPSSQSCGQTSQEPP